MSKYPGADCENCPLQDRPLVPSFGPDKAKFVLVGEAPGVEEVAAQKPFIGKSGKLLNEILRHHNIDRDEVFVTNACLCRPVKNETPHKDAIKACNNRLLAEVASREPTRVLAAGAVAAKAMLGTKEGITKLRAGGPKPSPYGDYEVVPTFHPAAALRDPGKFPSIAGDVGKLAHLEIGYEETKFKVMQEVGPAIRMLQKQVESSPLLTLDIEVDYKKETHTRATPEWLCIGISHRPGGAVVYDEAVVKHPMFQAELARQLARRDKQWGYHNGKFDIQYLWSFAPEARVDQDSMLMHYATDERKGTHDLEQVAAEILGAPSYKQEAKEHNVDPSMGLAGLPPHILWQYNAMDVDATHRLLHELRKRMEADNVVRPYEELLIPGANVLARVEHRGINVDIPYLDALDEELRLSLEEKEAALRAIMDINPRSPQQIKKACHELGFMVKTTNKAQELGAYAGKHPFFDALFAYKDDHKLHSTYVKGLLKRLDKDGRIHPGFNLQTTETGRLSSSDPNAQNIPKGPRIRDAFTASDGMTLISADYSQIEYRLAGILSGDENLIQQFREGRKFHHEVAVALFGEDYDAKQYTKAKGTNFSIIYLVSPPGLSQGIGVSVKEAGRIIDEWYKTYPGVRQMQLDIMEQVRTKGEIVSYFGRKRRFPLLTGETIHDAYKEACNFPLQSAASDLNLKALIRLEPELRGTAHPIITVHDSLTFEAPVEAREDVARTMKRVMEDCGELSEICPITVDLSSGFRWGSEEELEV